MSPQHPTDGDDGDVERKKVGPHCDVELWSAFRAHVREKYGRTNGVLSYELERALRQYLDGGVDGDQQAVANALRGVAREIEGWSLRGSIEEDGTDGSNN